MKTKKGAPSIKILAIANQLDCLQQFNNSNNNNNNNNDNNNNKNDNDDDVPPVRTPTPCLPPPPLYDSSLSMEDEESDLEG